MKTNVEEVLLNKIEVTKFETFISDPGPSGPPPTNESLQNTPENWELIKKDTNTYLKITPNSQNIWFANAQGRLNKQMLHASQQWANQKGQLR